MNTVIRRNLILTVAVFAFGAIWAPIASAECGNPLNDKGHLSRQSWHGPEIPSANLLLASDRGPSMVGMWHVVFIAEGNGPGLPPDGTQVDSTLAQWHRDGTEITLASRPPQTGDVCLGVWEEVGPRHFHLNHFGIAFDPSVDPNTPQGFANIHQDIHLHPDGKSFKGAFIIDQYDATGNLLVEIKGDLIGTRVTQSTTVSDLLRN